MIAGDRPVTGPVLRSNPRRRLEKVHAVAYAGRKISGTPERTQRDVRNVIVRTAPIGQSGRIVAQQRTKSVLLLCRRGRHLHVHPQQVGAR